MATQNINNLIHFNKRNSQLDINKTCDNPLVKNCGQSCNDTRKWLPAYNKIGLIKDRGEITHDGYNLVNSAQGGSSSDDIVVCLVSDK